MTGKKKKPLMDHDPLEWVDDETGDSTAVIEAAEPMSETKIDDVSIVENSMNTIILEESEKLDRVAELQEALLQLLEKSGDIKINASAVKVIDAAALQLLVLFFQKAVKQGQAVTIVEHQKVSVKLPGCWA